MSSSMQLRTIATIADVPQSKWNALLDTCATTERYENPFICHQFLACLEESKCVAPQEGWMPIHLLLQQGEQLLAAAPTYVKGHSQGEYVFDHAWADAYHRAGGEYYPKLLCAVPFSPVSGSRLLTNQSQNSHYYRAKLANGLKQLCHQGPFSSVHVNFLPQDEAVNLQEQGFLLRTSSQFHWHNNNYKSFEEFQANLASRKRKAIKKERQTALSKGLQVEWVSGADITEAHLDAFFEFYMNTSDRKWGAPYLNRTFFSLLTQSMKEHLLFIFAKRGNTYIAGALNLIGRDTLFGRNWGCIEHHPCLHFELCYYQAIEYAIVHKLAVVEAGAQGEHKLSRGYLPQTTYSAHYLKHQGLKQAVDNYLQHERAAISDDQELLRNYSPFRRIGHDL
ncbi:GNAT family N-acetyltransferase [Polycladidibacter stylochi]|uniref:GNAT family N-acetyltransferase n=1 Tax=Polycladidibacter stylochi TaxID=1807766 RepID=UPI000AF01A8F|nr:GNAT family N-acetyltransferase [Pseudovibrio stylochi]